MSRILTPWNAFTQLPRSEQIHSGMTEQVVVSSNNGNPADFSRIFQFTSKIGQKIFLPNRTKVRGNNERGYALILSLKTSGNVEISGNAEIHIAVQSPSDDAPDFIRRLTYQTFRDLDTQQQRSEDYRARLAQSCDLNTDGAQGLHQLLTLPEDWKLSFWIKNTSDVVDFTGGRSYIELPVFMENK